MTVLIGVGVLLLAYFIPKYCMYLGAKRFGASDSLMKVFVFGYAIVAPNLGILGLSILLWPVFPGGIIADWLPIIQMFAMVGAALYIQSNYAAVDSNHYLIFADKAVNRKLVKKDSKEKFHVISKEEEYTLDVQHLDSFYRATYAFEVVDANTLKNLYPYLGGGTVQEAISDLLLKGLQGTLTRQPDEMPLELDFHDLGFHATRKEVWKQVEGGAL